MNASALASPLPGHSPRVLKLVSARPRELAARSDEELIASYRDGHHQALTVLLRRHETRIRRICERMADDAESARDLYQETMVGVVRNLASYRGDAAFMTWVFAVTRSFAHRQRRRTRAAQRVEQIVREVAVGARSTDEPEVALARQELKVRLSAAMAALAPLDRAVLLARDYEGLTAPEVAQRLDLSIGAVKSRLHRARRQVRRQFCGETSALARTM